MSIIPEKVDFSKLLDNYLGVRPDWVDPAITDGAPASTARPPRHPGSDPDESAEGTELRHAQSLFHQMQDVLNYVKAGATLEVAIASAGLWIEDLPGIKSLEAAKAEANAKALEIYAATACGTQTLADLPWGAPPAQLVHPFLTPDGVTILYGPGGVGKGWLAIYFAQQLVRSGKKVMVIDFENHPHEWGRRARSLGFTEEELAAVAYRAPYAATWTADKGDLHTVADLVRADMDAFGATYLIVDSYTTATSTGDSMGGAAAAQEFFEGVSRIGRATLVIAHVAGGGNKFPDKPFGSVFVHNLARETWAVEQTEMEEQEAFDPATFDLQPHVMALELRSKKRNGGQRPPPQFLSFSFDLLGDVDVDTQNTSKPKLSDEIEEILNRSTTGMTPHAIAAAIKSDTGETRTTNSIRWALNHSPLRFSSSNETPLRWSVKPPR